MARARLSQHFRRGYASGLTLALPPRRLFPHADCDCEYHPEHHALPLL